MEKFVLKMDARQFFPGQWDKMTPEEQSVWRKKLRDIMEAEQGERLVLLPCKVTDTVYILESVLKGKKVIGERVVSAQIDHVTIGGTTGKPVFDLCSETGVWYYSVEPGEFYLTREDAEAAISKRGDHT